jgi:hypothetical protein
MTFAENGEDFAANVRMQRFSQKDKSNFSEMNHPKLALSFRQLISENARNRRTFENNSLVS